MFGFKPPRPSGSTPKARFDQWVHDALVMLLNPGDSSTVRVDRKNGGFIWHAKPQIASGPAQSLAIKPYHFKQSFGDYFLTQEGTSIAKCPKLRNSITSQNIYGTTVQFTYPHNIAGDPLYGLYRVASVVNVGTTENEGVTPQFLVGDLIYAIQISTGVVSEAADTSQPVGTAVGWLHWNIDGQAWTRFSNPAF